MASAGYHAAAVVRPSWACRWSYIPDAPGRGNHKNIFTDAGVEWKEYRYFDRATVGLAFEGMLEDLKAAPEGSIVVLHGGPACRSSSFQLSLHRPRQRPESGFPGTHGLWSCINPVRGLNLEFLARMACWSCIDPVRGLNGFSGTHGLLVLQSVLNI